MWGTSLKTADAKPFSIKRRLILTSVGVAAFLVLISWVSIFFEAHHEIDEVYDARLGQSAKILALSMPHLLREPADIRAQAYSGWYQNIQRYGGGDDDTLTPYGHPYEQNLMFQFYSQGEILIKSPGAPDTLIGEPGTLGYGKVEIDGEPWRRFQIELPPQHGMLKPAYLVVAEKQAIRRELINEIAVSTAAPQLILIAVLAVTLILITNKFFRPINELRQAISERHINRLDAISVKHPTIELEPLVRQLNYMLGEVEKAWSREKRLTQTAAHELKTPLAVLRLNAENALDALSRQQHHELRSDLQQILRGIERTDRVIQQLLMLSRVEAHHNQHIESLDLAENLRNVIANLVPLALKNDQHLALDGPESVRIMGYPILLSVLFSNLMDNAIRYAGKEADITVTLSTTKDWVEVTVSDSGEAIPDSLRDKIFEKFFRAHTERGDGAGLGMSIIKDIASLHGGSIELLPASGPHGNQFRVKLPARSAQIAPVNVIAKTRNEPHPAG